MVFAHVCFLSLLCAPSSSECSAPSNSRGVAAAGGDSGRARQARFQWDPALRGGMLDSIEAELALRAAALASGTLPSAVWGGVPVTVQAVRPGGLLPVCVPGGLQPACVPEPVHLELSWFISVHI